MAKNDKNRQEPDEDNAAELLLKEADEALRQENLQNIWQEWGSTIIGVALMLVFGTMIGVGWKNWRTSVYSSQTSSLITAQEKGIPGLISPNSQLSGHYFGIAKMIAAGQVAVATDTNNKVTANLLYKLMEEASDTGLPKQWDILAEWGYLRSLIDSENKTDKTAIAKGLEDLSKRKSNPYAPAILMESAVLYGENDDKEKAVILLEQAKNNDLSASVPELIAQIDGLINLYKIEIAMATKEKTL